MTEGSTSISRQLFTINLLARFRGAPLRLDDAVRGLSREQLIEIRNGKWSIQENAGHLLGEEDLFARRLRAHLESAEILPPAPYANVKLTHNGRDIQNILIDFRVARGQQVEQLSRLSPEDFGRSAWHPRLNLKCAWWITWCLLPNTTTITSHAFGSCGLLKPQPELDCELRLRGSPWKGA